MPNMDVAIESPDTIRQDIVQALQTYQDLVKRADRLTQKILRTQQTVDVLKQLTQTAEQYVAEPHCNVEQWIIQLRHQCDQLPYEAYPNNGEVSQSGVEMAGGIHAQAQVSCETCNESDVEQLRKQYQQHQASCQLMEQHCDQSHHYLQLLRYQADQLREGVSTLLSQVIQESVHVETIVSLQERLLARPGL